MKRFKKSTIAMTVVAALAACNALSAHAVGSLGAELIANDKPLLVRFCELLTRQRFFTETFSVL